MVNEIRDRDLSNNTVVILSAKHGQSPINPVLTNKPGHFADLVAALPDAPMPAENISMGSAPLFNGIL